MRIILLVASTWLVMLGLAGCGAKEAILKPYKLEIQQGNVVTSKMLLQLRPGMTKSQVRFIMGTPLIVDSFHDDRWDYFYQLRQGGKIVQQRRVILDFDKELLAHVRGDVVPQGTPGADTADAPVSQSIAKPEKEKSLLEKLEFWKSDQKEGAGKPLATEPALVHPDAEGAEAAKPQAVTTPETPAAAPQSEEDSSGSMLAVPIPLIPATESPAASPSVSPPASAPTSSDEDNAAGAVVTEPIDTSPVEAAPAAAPESQVAPEAIQPTAKEAPAEPPAPAPSPKVVKEKAPDSVVPMEPPAAAVPASNVKSNQASKPADTKQPVEPASDESDEALDPPPGYFERLLEKIGF